MRVASARALLLLLVSLFLAAPEASADVALAEALFQEGRRLMDEGKHEAACVKLEESLRIDRGTGTLWHLARCYEKTKRLASAWAKFHEVAQQARRQKEPLRVEAALSAARALRGKLARLAVVVLEKNRVPGLKVTKNDAPIRPGTWGTALPEDSGLYQIEAAAKGYSGWSTKVKLEDGETKTVEVPELVQLETKTKKFSADSRTKWHEDWVGWTVAGAGVVALAAGTGSLVHANSLARRANEDGVVLDEFRQLRRRSDNFRLAGVVLVSTGALTAAVGVVKLALHDSQPKVRNKGANATLSVRDGGFVLGFKGAF